jgi:hypothetical protein
MDALEQIDKRLSSKYSIHQFLGSPKWDEVKKGILALTPEGVAALQVAGRFDIASYALYNDPMLDWVLMVYNGIRAIGYEEGLDVKRTINLTLDAGESEDLDVLFDRSAQVLFNLTVRGSMEAKYGAVATDIDIGVDALVAGFIVGDFISITGFANAINNIADLQIADIQNGVGTNTKLTVAGATFMTETNQAVLKGTAAKIRLIPENGQVDLDGDGNTDIIFTFNQGNAVNVRSIAIIPYDFKIVYIEKVYSDALGVGFEFSYPSLADVLNVITQTNAKELTTTSGLSRL